MIIILGDLITPNTNNIVEMILAHSSLDEEKGKSCMIELDMDLESHQ
jgi:primosomal replication protein N